MEANNEEIIEEKIMVEQGEIIISKYYKKNLSGKGENITINLLILKLMKNSLLK